MNELVLKTFIRALRELGYYDVFPKTLGYSPIEFFGENAPNLRRGFSPNPFFGCNSYDKLVKKLDRLCEKQMEIDKVTQIGAIVIPLNHLLHFFLAVNGKSLDVINEVGDYVFSSVGTKLYGKKWVEDNAAPKGHKPNDRLEIESDDINEEKLRKIKEFLDSLTCNI